MSYCHVGFYGAVLFLRRSKFELNCEKVLVHEICTTPLLLMLLLSSVGNVDVIDLLLGHNNGRAL